MKLKTTTTFFLIVLFAGNALISCKDNEVDNYVFHIDRGGETLLFTNAGNNETAVLTASHDWQITSKPEWVNVTPSFGSGNDKEVLLSISTGPNPVGERSGQIVFNMGKDNLWINVRQRGSFVLHEYSGDDVHALTLSENGRYMAGRDMGSGFYIWDLTASGSRPERIPGFSSPHNFVSITNDGLLYEGGSTPDGKFVLGWRREQLTDNPYSSVFYVPTITENGVTVDLEYPETDIYGKTPSEGYNGVMPIDISHDGNVITGQMHIYPGAIMVACIWERNTWGNYKFRTVELANEPFVARPIKNGLSRDGRYLLFSAYNYTTRETYPVMYNVETSSRVEYRDIPHQAFRIINGGAFIVMGYSGTVYVYEGGDELVTFEDWMLENYNIIIPSSYTFLRITGLAEDKSFVAWTSRHGYGGSDWRNFVVRPYQQ